MPTALAACTGCGTEFDARGNAAYCSPACRQRAYRRQHKNGVRVDVSRPATIGSLIAALDAITGELEKHISDMNYPGTDEFNVHTFHRHPFADDAYEVLQDLTQRMAGVSNDLCGAEDERRNLRGSDSPAKEDEDRGA